MWQEEGGIEPTTIGFQDIYLLRQTCRKYNNKFHNTQVNIKETEIAGIQATDSKFFCELMTLIIGPELGF